MLGWWRGHPGGHASSYGRAAIADHLALMYGRMQRVRELVANVSASILRKLLALKSWQ
jgi:hypothetical protein